MRSILAGLAASFLSLTASTSGWAGKPIYTVLHRFTDSRDGNPIGGFLLGRGGVLYGTAEGGIYKLTPPGAGQTVWGYEVIHRFDLHPEPIPTRLIADASGVLYGALREPPTIFKLSPPVAPNPGWTYEVLNQHTSENALSLDADGNLYGSAANKVFRLSRPTTMGAPWGYSILHYFSDPAFGDSPSSPLVIHQVGGTTTLFGTTYLGGNDASGLGSNGVAYQLTSPPANQTAWGYKIISNFNLNGCGGMWLNGNLVRERDGTLIGVSLLGGGFSAGGIAYALTPPAQGRTDWTCSNLHNFVDNVEGYRPSGLFESPSGTLYGILKREPFREIVSGLAFALSPRASPGPRKLNALARLPLLLNELGEDNALVGGPTRSGILALYGVTCQGVFQYNSTCIGTAFQITFAPGP